MHGEPAHIAIAAFREEGLQVLPDLKTRHSWRKADSVKTESERLVPDCRRPGRRWRRRVGSRHQNGGFCAASMP